MGLSSIGFIGVILGLFYYLFAILGMLMFQENDPWHFGTLHMAMISLFRASTLEDWTDIMYINLYGCRDHPAGEYDGPTFGTESGCVNDAKGIVAAIYWIVFIIIGALVLLTLFIGVVTTSMEEATEKQKEEEEVEGRVKQFAEKEGLSVDAISRYRTVFAMLDLDGGGTIEEE